MFPGLSVQTRQSGRVGLGGRYKPCINQTQLWHLRLGHINLKRIQRLVSCGPLATLTLEQLPLCQNCIQGKMTKRSFTAKGVRAQSKALDKFKEFKAESEKQLGRHIKSLLFDRGGEYMSIEFVSFLKEHEILSPFSALGTPQQNGVAERRN